MRLQITTFPRIHLTLIGMNNEGYRINGGVGFSIASPTLNLQFTESLNWEINDYRQHKFLDKELKRLIATLDHAYHQLGLTKKINCIINGYVFPHSGFGSTTAIYLSCVESLFIINQIDYDFEKIISFSKRGGTSGIGVNTYFHGGYVFDLGIDNEVKNLVPSSVAKTNGKKALVLKQNVLPDWSIGLCVPDIPKKTEEQEIDFFRKNCPIDISHVKNILYEVVFGITSSLLENNYDIFCSSVKNIQTTKWKELERSNYEKDILEIEQEIIDNGADCVGMSSFGPMLFFMGQNINEIISKTRKKYSSAIYYNTKFNNSGRIIQYD